MKRIALACSWLLVGCGAARYGASYSGVWEEPLTSAERVVTVEAVPASYERLGRVSVRCKVLRDYQALSDEPFANVDCTEQRLRRALRERAAEVGGELLAGLDCRRSSGELRCDAQVARPDDDALARRSPERAAASPPSPAPDPESVARIEEPHVSRSWAILVSFDSRLPFERAARPPSKVDRAGDVPVQHLPLGDMEARCDRGECEARELAHALRVAAARVGAHSLAAVRCFDDRHGHACVGTLGAESSPE